MESLSKIAERRLHPPITDPSYLLLRARRKIFEDWARRVQGEQLTALDIGGRYQPYRPLFADRIRRYVAVDLLQTEFVSVVADGQALPFAPQTFDVVIATQVLDCLRDPIAAMHHIHALLKPGGIFLASVPACAPRFADVERWRFLPSGLRTMLEPFSTVEIVAELDSLRSMIRTVNLALDTFVRYDSPRRIYRLSLCPLLNLLGLGFERLNLTSNDRFAANFSVRAMKGI
jgi:NADH dehydrogenase [ubiquinone] 1 alpha subcomplex assembly factor 5